MQLKQSFLWSIFNSFFVSVVGFLSYSFLAKNISQSDFGFYSYALNILGSFVVLASFGTHLISSKLRNHFLDDEKYKIYLFQTFFFSSLITAIAFFLSYNYLPNFGQYNTNLFFYFLLIIVLASFQRLISDYFRSKEKFILYFLLNSFGSNSGILFWMFFSVAIVSIKQYDSLSIENIFKALTLSSLIPVILLFLKKKNIIFTFLKKLPGEISFFNHEYHFFLKSCFMLLCIVLLRTVKDTSAFWILGYTSDTKDIGIFFTAYKLSFIILTPLIIIENVIPQNVSKLYKSGSKIELENFIRKISSYRFIVCISMIIVSYIFAESILTIFFGEDYIVATKSFQIIALSMIPSIFVGPCISLLILTTHQNKYILIDSLIMIPFIIGGVILSNYSSYYGMAIAFSVMNFITHILYFFYTKKALKINTLPYLSLKKNIQIFKKDFID